MSCTSHNPLIVSHQTSVNTELFHWLKSDISKLNIVATYDFAAQFVKKGFGYVIALDKLINTAEDSNLCFRPLSPTLEAEPNIVWKNIRFFQEPPLYFYSNYKSKLNIPSFLPFIYFYINKAETQQQYCHVLPFIIWSQFLYISSIINCVGKIKQYNRQYHQVTLYYHLYLY